MNSFKNTLLSTLAAAFILTLSGCAPEVGSEAWCNDMKQKESADWTANQATDFAKNCLLK
ncbi:MAG: DUF3012 domain-containing protein [Cycloclasticus sp.]|nr:hypothetical protein A9Q80_02065 [Cycloclasticus sp. 46_83_sub15_T18]OUR83556.1 hypothetical protein A9Q82_02410 [Cycloclasticus sp. 46_120_T64]